MCWLASPIVCPCAGPRRRLSKTVSPAKVILFFALSLLSLSRTFASLQAYQDVMNKDENADARSHTTRFHYYPPLEAWDSPKHYCLPRLDAPILLTARIKPKTKLGRNIDWRASEARLGKYLWHY